MGLNNNYYGIIPSTILHHDDLKANEKLIYAHISNMTNKKGYCFAQNSHFAELFDVTKATVSSWINRLKKMGFVRVRMIKDDKGQVKERRIYIRDDPLRVFSEKEVPPQDENGDPHQIKPKYNNTSVNNTSTKGNARAKKKYKAENIYPFNDYNGKPATVRRSHNEMLETGEQSLGLKNGIIDVGKKYRDNVYAAQMLYNSLAMAEGLQIKDTISALDNSCWSDIKNVRGFDFYKAIVKIKKNGFVQHWLDSDWRSDKGLFFWLISKEENYKRAISHKNNSRTKRPERQ